jgi:uncharacterized membrane protein YoaK (UPF0700 family)
VFNHEGPARNARKNAMLAGYLAFVAGWVNSGGYVLIGSFTSHVTGSIGRLSHDVAVRDPGAGAFALLLVVTFFAGAFVASLILETNAFADTARAYGVALALESAMLALFIFVAGLSRATHARVLDSEAAVLCLAMGMQNSLVTRLSGAVVRTTHLTGVVTDLGIEAARWYRWHRARLSAVPLLIRPRVPPERPPAMRTILLLTIVAAFTVGAVIGALLTLHASRWAMLFPSLAVLAASAYAFSPAGRGDDGDQRKNSAPNMKST